MTLVCLIGQNQEKKNQVEEILKKLGYNHLMGYTTENLTNTVRCIVDKSEFEHLINKNMLMIWEEINSEYYGLLKPIGSTYNVVQLDENNYCKVRQMYGEQAIGIYISTKDETTNNTEYSLVVTEEDSANSIVSKILSLDLMRRTK